MEQLARLWAYTYEVSAHRFLKTWLLALRWRSLSAFKKRGKLLTSYLDGIQSYCYENVPFAKVEAIKANIRTMLRGSRGYRDHDYLLLKVNRGHAARRHGQAI